MSRRQFCSRSVALLVGLGVSPRLARLLAGPGAGKEVRWHKKLSGNRVQCNVCPLNCILTDGQVCFCRTRVNRGGTCYTMAYENPSVVGIDPIEKGPFAHYLPGSRAFAMGTSGCNLRCLYCQNFEQSQKVPLETENISLRVGDVTGEAAAEKCKNILFTYTEPVAFHEYAVDVAREARRAGYRVQAATAAYANPAPFTELVNELDAVTISLKGFTEEFYQRVCGQSLAPVLESIKIAHRSRAWLELVTLVIPGYNDSVAEAHRMGKWLVTEVGPDVPVHLARFFPAYKLKDLAPTPMPLLEAHREALLAEGVRFVYLSNVGLHPATSTYCHNCKVEVIARAGLAVRENRLVGGACPACKTRLPGVWS